VIRVGGATEVEVKERKDRVDDAMHATRAAVEEGILPGGGVALLRSVKALGRLKTENHDQKTGIDIVRKALSTPARQIAVNAGEDGSIVVGKISENDTYAFGYDAQEGEYGDLVSKGIIDPTKVVRTALQDAASIAGLLMTTEAMVAEKPKKETPMPAPIDKGRPGRCSGSPFLTNPGSFLEESCRLPRHRPIRRAPSHAGRLVAQAPAVPKRPRG
jgi:chaperonin GroEL